MRRADRLFQIIQILRRSNRPVTAADIAGELEVSKRTVYRDIADLMGQRVPIEGEAGFGYLLDSEYDMPPLMLTPDEIEAVVLGAQWVTGHADAVLSNAARDLVAKIALAVPERLRPFIAEPSVGAKPGKAMLDSYIDISQLRMAIRGSRKLRLVYRIGFRRLRQSARSGPSFLVMRRRVAFWLPGANCARTFVISEWIA